MRKRLVAALLLAAALCQLCGCAPGGGAKKKINLILKAPAQEMNCASNPDIATSEAFLEYVIDAFCGQYEEADVTIQLRMFSLMDEISAVPATFDTDDAPDLLYENYSNMAAYIHTGRVVPLDDVISDELRADIAETTWEISAIGGKTYMMPFLYMQNVLIFNKRHFLDCGLDAYCGKGTEIQNWTMDEWTAVLDALAEGLPEGVYPLAMYANNNQGDTHIMSYLRAFGGKIFDSGGNFDLDNPETVRALRWLQDGVARGWYPPHPENLVMKDCSELFAGQRLAMYNFNGANKALYDDLDNYGFVNYPGNVATSFITGFEVFDNGDPECVAAAKDFLRFLYGAQELLDLSAGNIPASRSTTERFAGQITMLEDFSKNTVNVVDFMNNSPNWQGADDSVRSVFYPHIHDLLAGRTTPEQCAADLNADCNTALERGRERSVLHN